jgi:hypothetical protein
MAISKVFSTFISLNIFEVVLFHPGCFYLNGASKNDQSAFDLFAAIPGFKNCWTKFCEPTSATFFATWLYYLTVNILLSFMLFPAKMLICNVEAAAG